MTMLTLLLLAFVAQDSTPPSVPSVNGGGSIRAAADVSAEELRGRINKMRMNLLLGGEQVRRAEGEAVIFYNGKVTVIDDRLDSISAELSEKRASYDLLLERALEGDSAGARAEAMGEASRMRSGITSLENESTGLTRKREHMTKMISNVEARDRERGKLVAQLETGTDYGDPYGFPTAGIGLAPISSDPVEAGSPLDDSLFVQDLMERDPRGARRLLYETDPQGYWTRFPLKPPTDALRDALRFPLQDLPGQR